MASGISSFTALTKNVKVDSEQIMQCYKFLCSLFRVVLQLLKISDKVFNFARLLKMQYFILMVFKAEWRTNISGYSQVVLCARHHHVRRAYL